MTKAYMPFYTGDFVKKTMHLGATERGCYISLLIHCWEHGSIPTDNRKLALICGCNPKIWHQYQSTVLQFFTPVNTVTGPSIMTHDRVSTELLRYKEKAKHFKEGAEKRSETFAQNLANQNQNQNQEEKKESLPPLAAGHAPPSEEGSKQATPPLGFAEFWLAYPKKVSKPAALRAWRQAIKRAPSDVIMDALRAQKQAWKDPQYIKHPSTWLNNDCWSDQVEEKPKWHVLI